MELIETVNDEEILYVRRTNSPEEFGKLFCLIGYII